MRRDVLLTWLLLPGAMLHELTHILIGVRYGGYSVRYIRAERKIPTLILNVPIIGGRIRSLARKVPIVGVRLTFHWPAEAPLWAVLATQVAPLVFGLWLAPAVAYGLLWAASVRLPVAFVGWVVLNWLLYVGLSAVDLADARATYHEWPITSTS